MAHSMMTLLNRAEAAFEAAIAAAEPGAAVERALAGLDVRPGAGGRVVAVALGKAGPAMMAALEARMPEADGLVVTSEGTAATCRAQVLTGAHPVPDHRSEAAGAALLAHVTGLWPEDRVIALISGGGSALAVAPKQGVTLADKARMNEVLLASGLDIVAMNLIRQQVSRLKGGGLAAAASPAPVTGLILSDVIGDDLRAVASGPTCARVGPAEEAARVAREAGIWDELPLAVRRVLSAGASTSAQSANNILIGSNRQSVEAAATQVSGIRIAPAPVVGDVTDAVQDLLREATSGPFVAGGETTVRLSGTGRGGRNQDLALRFALEAEKQGLMGDWAFLSGGTDGRDGPTDAAGAVVTPQTLAKIRAAGFDPAERLANNDAYPALEAGGALLKRPPTGTNVADVQIFLKGTSQ